MCDVRRVLCVLVPVGVHIGCPRSLGWAMWGRLCAGWAHQMCVYTGRREYAGCSCGVCRGVECDQPGTCTLQAGMLPELPQQPALPRCRCSNKTTQHMSPRTCRKDNPSQPSHPHPPK